MPTEYLEVLKDSLGSMPALVAMSTVRMETLARIRVKIRAFKVERYLLQS